MVTSGTSSSADRFYCPPARRQLRAAAAAEAARQAAEKEKMEREREEERGREMECNLERFIASTSPVVPAQFLPVTSMRQRRPTTTSTSSSEMTETPLNQAYFNLGELWESFNEWSAYGAGVPLVLNGTDSVMQYYVPFLSALQLFVEKPDPNIRSRRRESEGEETTSSDDSENEINMNGNEETGFSSDDSESSNPGIQFPVFEFFEHDPPYARQPLSDKILNLANKCPELKIYRSCDLSPASWISVAWYPIYRIPTGPTLQDLDACFLTFHSLSTNLKSDESSNSSVQIPKLIRTNSSDEISHKLSLPLLGLASYKFKGPIWTSNFPQERELATNLMQTADDWLSSRHVSHPDFQFFISHYTY
ncbi:hypothetical protein LUZ60_003505 [Juncus effusus]|nr:hypothetical protein LUZ60_003505 [Juncus effusus]